MKYKYYPSALNVTGRPCLVIGDGAEASLKAARLREAGADVQTVSEKKYRPSQLKDKFFVVLVWTSDLKLTKSVSKICREKKILLCAIDRPDYCDIVNVAVMEKGPLRIMISTDGIAPALAKSIRKGLEAGFEGTSIESFLDYLKDLREKLRKDADNGKDRRKKLIDAVKGFEFKAKVKVPHLLILGLVGLIGLGCGGKKADLRLGYSPNLTHAQALIGVGEGRFKSALGPRFTFSAQEFHAGPSIIEALFAGAIDMAFVGPNPAINCHVRSGGEFVIVSGAASGGAALVVSEKSRITRLDQLRDKKILTPQLANTQDVTARAFFLEKGWTPSLYPVSNPDHINLFLKQDVDASWTVEPWVSRLVHETKARVLFDESEVWKEWGEEHYSTTLLIVNKAYLKENKELVSEFIKSHVQITAWINTHAAEAKKICNQQLGELLGKPLAVETLDDAWDRIRFTLAIYDKALARSALNARAIGFLKGKENDLENLIDERILRTHIKRS